LQTGRGRAASAATGIEGSDKGEGKRFRKSGIQSAVDPGEVSGKRGE